MDQILSDMDMRSIERLVYALQNASAVEDAEPVHSKHRLRQEQVSEALWKMAQLVEVGLHERERV